MSERHQIRVVESRDRFHAGERLALTLEKPLRYLPGRRCVARASLEDGSTVLLKRYVHPVKANADARHEWGWLNRLTGAGLPVPQPLCLARATDGSWAVMMAFISNARELREVLESTENAAAEPYLRRLIALVHDTHEAGFIQEDLHLGNYLLGSGGNLSIIDAGSHRQFSLGLPDKERVLNWALLRGNLFLGQRAAFDRAFAAGPAAPLLDAVRDATPAILKRRLRRFRNKCQRTCTQFVKVEKGGMTMLRKRSLDPEWLEALAACSVEALANACPVIKRASKCLVVQGERDGVAWVLKTHWHEGWRQSLRQSRTRRSWIAGHALRLLGLRTPEPLAFWECRSGARLVRDGLLMVKDTATPLHRWVREPHSEEERARVVQEVSHFFQALSELRVSHGDTKASNFHVGPSGDLRVIDLDSFQWTGPRWRKRLEKDRERFARNALKFPAGETIFQSVWGEDKS